MSIAGPMTRRYDAFMAQATQTRPDAAPAPLRFTRAEYYRMAEAGLFEGRRKPRPPREHRPEIPQKAGERPDRLKVFEEYLRGLGDDDKADKTDKPEDQGKR